jgi:hypothetical protein
MLSGGCQFQVLDDRGDRPKLAFETPKWYVCRLANHHHGIHPNDSVPRGDDEQVPINRSNTLLS